MTSDAEDRSTWPHNGEIMGRTELLRLIEEKGWSEDLDLRGVAFVGDKPGDDTFTTPIDLSPEALNTRAEAYRKANGGKDPNWLADGGGIKLSEALLHMANLSGARLQGASLWGAQLQGAALWGARLQGVDLYNVGSLEGVHWSDALLDHTRIKRETLGQRIGDELTADKKKTPRQYHLAKEAYLLLKNNFNQIGRYEDASWAYVKEQQMEKMQFHWEWRAHGWRVWRAWDSFWPWFRNWFYELLTGYGERPILPLLWAGGLAVVFFPLLYWAIGAREDHARGFTSWSPSDIDWAGWGDSVVFSLVSFGTLSFTQLQPDGTLPTVIAAFEAMVGVLLFALFVFTLGNRMSRS